VQKFEVYACEPRHEDIDMRDARELRIRFIEPRKRNWYDSDITLLSGTARIRYKCEEPDICYDNNRHYVLIEHDGKVLFDSRTVFPVNMQEFAKNREDYIAQMVERGASRENLNL
jgi:hypothetical protein